MSKKIAVFGGAFDPFHLGHLSVVKNILGSNLADEVWILPVGKHAFDKNLADSKDRLAMIELGLLDLLPIFKNKVKIELCEIEKKGLSVTYDTLSWLSKKHSNLKFLFVMGSDNIHDFHKWQHYLELVNQYEFLVYPREGHDFAGMMGQMRALKDFPQISISSTLIKEKMKKKLSIKDLVSSSVEQYIYEHELYLR